MTGAGGRTGKLILQKLMACPEHFEARGLVRTPEVGLASFKLGCLCLLNLLSLPVPLSFGLWLLWTRIRAALIKSHSMLH